MTDAEKATANKEAEDAANAAKTAIDEAVDAQGVDTAKAQGVSAINNVSTESTPEEKDAAKADVERLANEAKAAIDQAKDAQGVETAKTDGVSAINNVSTEQKVHQKQKLNQQLTKH